MKSTMILIFVFLFGIPKIVLSAELYEITDNGMVYSWYSDSDARTQYLDKHLSYVDKKERDKLKKLSISPYYSPSNGNIGKLVSLLKKTDGSQYYILDVLGNHILINSKGAKKTSTEKYKQFKVKVKGYDRKYFGFVIGKTTESEAIEVLKSSKAIYKSNLAYKGYNRLPVIQIQKYNQIPVINGNHPNYVSLNFLDDVLYQIIFEWSAKSSNIFDIRVFNKKKIHGDVIEGLIGKYGKYKREDVGGITNWHFWLNKTKLITLTSPEYTATRLQYSSITLVEKASALKEKIDLEIERKTLKEKNDLIKSQL